MQVCARRNAVHSGLMPDDDIAGLSAASDLAELFFRGWFQLDGYR